MNILTDEHKGLINKKIKKAINEIDFNEIVADYIEKEFDALWEDCEVRHDLQYMVTDVVKEKLVEVGLLNGKETIED